MSFTTRLFSKPSMARRFSTSAFHRAVPSRYTRQASPAAEGPTPLGHPHQGDKVGNSNYYWAAVGAGGILSYLIYSSSSLSKPTPVSELAAVEDKNTNLNSRERLQYHQSTPNTEGTSAKFGKGVEAVTTKVGEKLHDGFVLIEGGKKANREEKEEKRLKRNQDMSEKLSSDEHARLLQHDGQDPSMPSKKSKQV